VCNQKRKSWKKEMINVSVGEKEFWERPTLQHPIMIVQTKGTSIIAHARVWLKTWPHDAPTILTHCQPNDGILGLFFQVTIFDQFQPPLL
jgi:hypothetical protein